MTDVSQSKEGKRLVALRDKQRAHIPLVLYGMGWSEDGPLKIGITENVGTRVAAAQVNCPYLMCIYLQWSGPREIVRAMELALHKTFDAKRMYGEWFNISLADLRAELVKEGATS